MNLIRRSFVRTVKAKDSIELLFNKLRQRPFDQQVVKDLTQFQLKKPVLSQSQLKKMEHGLKVFITMRFMTTGLGKFLVDQNNKLYKSKALCDILKMASIEIASDSAKAENQLVSLNARLDSLAVIERPNEEQAIAAESVISNKICELSTRLNSPETCLRFLLPLVERFQLKKLKYQYDLIDMSKIKAEDTKKFTLCLINRSVLNRRLFRLEQAMGESFFDNLNYHQAISCWKNAEFRIRYSFQDETFMLKGMYLISLWTKMAQACSRINDDSEKAGYYNKIASFSQGIPNQQLQTLLQNFFVYFKNSFIGLLKMGVQQPNHNLWRERLSQMVTIGQTKPKFHQDVQHIKKFLSNS